MEQQRQLQRFVLPRIHILETIEYVKVIKKERKYRRCAAQVDKLGALNA
jgi:hypothetical protein